MNRTSRTRLLGRWMLLLCLLVLIASARSVPRAEATDSCGLSAGSLLCLITVDGPLSGDQTITATWGGAGTFTIEFVLNGKYLNYEYQAPYSFTWPTGKTLDGPYTLAARVHKGSTYGAFVQTTVQLSNGNITGVPRSAADYDSLFSPQPGSVFAAVGNAGAERPAESRLIDYIESTTPAVFMYLGEVHEYGTWATRRDHYGLASFDDPNGVGSWWGRMAGYTLPTAGNHEHDYMSQFQDYWHQRPLWSTTVVDGVRIFDLTSECQSNGGCTSQGTQARWLKAQLEASTESCVVAMWHRPVVSLDSKRSGTKMNPVWQLLAAAGGDLVLNADTRDMTEVRPMNASLQSDQPDSHMVQLISGAGAARWVTSSSNRDPRVAWRLYGTPGAVFVSHSDNLLTWQFRDSSGRILRTGSVNC